MADGNAAVMELRSADLSAAGIFLETEDLNALDLNEEVELRLGAPGERWHAAQARVVRSGRRFDGGTAQPGGTGFGLQFEQCEPGFQAAVAALLNEVTHPEAHAGATDRATASLAPTRKALEIVS